MRECLGVKPLRGMKVNCEMNASQTGQDFLDRSEYERICWDPKDGELCLSRMK